MGSHGTYARILARHANNHEAAVISAGLKLVPKKKKKNRKVYEMFFPYASEIAKRVVGKTKAKREAEREGRI